MHLKKAFYVCAAMIGILITVSPGAAVSESLSCPKVIATVQEGITTQAVGEAVKATYEKLGCETEFVPLPAARGIIHFNKGLVDGEVFRGAFVEQHYTRPFVRSRVPLMVLANSLWLHPDHENSERLPIGYLIGIVWQEDYIQGRHGRSYHRPEEMFDAFNKGEIQGFLSSDVAVEMKIEARFFDILPTKGETVQEVPVYHYTAQEFAPFMKAFSDNLKK